MKHIAFINKPTRRGSKVKSRSSASTKRKPSRARKVRISPAVRRKISLGVKRAMRARKSSRTSSMAVTRRPSYRPAKRRSSVARRSGFRSAGRRSTYRGRGFTVSVRSNPPGGIVGYAKSIVSKDRLMIVGGLIGSTMLTQYVLTNYGNKLPGYNTHWAVNVAYGAGIPIAASFLLRKTQPKLAEGLLYGGLVSAALGIINYVKASSAVAATGAYLPNNVGAAITTPGYDAINSFSAPGVSNAVVNTPSAFGKSAWGGRR